MGMGLQQMDIKNDFKGPDMHPLIDFSKTIQTSDESSTEPSNYDNEGLEAIADDDPPWLILQEEKEMAKKLMDNGLETFVQKEGPNQILNLLLEEQIDNVIFGEFFDFDDFGDWISCAAEDEDRRKQNKYLQTTIRKRCQWCFNWKRTRTVRDRKSLQVANCKACKAGRKTVDTQGFALHQTIPNQLSFWEEAEVKRQIDAMVALGHKSLAWFATASNAYGRGRRWINMLQDVSFQIINQVGSNHSNVEDARIKNPVEWAEEDEDFSEEIQDCEWMQQISKLDKTIWTGNQNSNMGLSSEFWSSEECSTSLFMVSKADEVPTAAGEIMVDADVVIVLQLEKVNEK
ncbi:unnamed protein product [Sphagnum balticum]